MRTTCRFWDLRNLRDYASTPYPIVKLTCAKTYVTLAQSAKQPYDMHGLAVCRILNANTTAPPNIHQFFTIKVTSNHHLHLVYRYPAPLDQASHQQPLSPPAINPRPHPHSPPARICTLHAPQQGISPCFVSAPHPCTIHPRR